VISCKRKAFKNYNDSGVYEIKDFYFDCAYGDVHLDITSGSALQIIRKRGDEGKIYDSSK
jgi:hypothetical protein